MRIFKKMLEAVSASLFAAALVLFGTLFFTAACTDKVTVRFEAFGGGAIGEVSAEAGEALIPPELPQTEGRVFVGWYLNSACEGEAVVLPEVVPASNITYYAKFEEYPMIALDAGGGTSVGKVYAPAGTPLIEALEGVTAEKEGLLFGAWTLAGRELTESDLVPEDGITVTAKYKAEYTVELRKENARGDGYDAERTVYTDWEGAVVSPEAPNLEHFTLLEELSTLAPLTLKAGENAVIFTYAREKLSLSFEGNAPAGSTFGGAMAAVSSRYEGIETLPECRFTAEGYAFLGWAEEPASPDFYEAGEEYTLGGENATLYAVWAEPFEDAHGEGGTLYVAVNGYEDGSRLALVREPERVEGKYFASGNALSLGGERGRLEHGHYLLDDSGSYAGYDLAANSVNTALGVLTLDFSAGRASYSKGGSEQAGSYAFVFDEGAGEYLGYYEFYAGETRFSFGLDKEKGVFVLEGEERGEYPLYDGGEATGEVLVLDGYGKADFSGERGRYAGGGGENEWLVTLGGEKIKVLLALREVSVGGIVFESEKVALLYREEYAGTFTSAAGTLTLDGCGAAASYSAGGSVLEGSYCAEGALVTLTSDGETLRFLLEGETFSEAGEGAGYFAGERGTLFLDGMGRAVLFGGETQTEGSYTALPTGDYAFGEMRFLLEGDTYLVFDEKLYGVYETLGGGLTLDGYGGGSYLSLTEGSFAVEVSRFGNTFEVYSEGFETLSHMRLFTLDALGTVFEVGAEEAGRYALAGTDEAAGLRLDGSGGAELLDGAGAVLASGSYTFDALTRRGTFALGLEEDFPLDYFRFRLREGECVLFSAEGQRSYYGEGMSLVFDGYGGGTLTFGGTSFYGDAEYLDGGILLASGERAYFVTIVGTGIGAAQAFSRYSGAEGVLYAGEGGALLNGAILPLAAAGGGEYVLGAGADARRVLLEGGRWYVRRDALANSWSTAAGTLILNAYGRGSLLTAAGAVSCEVVFAEGNYLAIAAGEEVLSAALGEGGFAVGSRETSFCALN